MRKLLLSLLMAVLCLGVFSACGKSNASTSEKDPYEGYEKVDPIENGGGYEFDE